MTSTLYCLFRDLFCFLVWGLSFVFVVLSFETESCHLAQAGLKSLAILLPQPHQCWGSGRAPPHLAGLDLYMIGRASGLLTALSPQRLSSRLSWDQMTGTFSPAVIFRGHNCVRDTCLDTYSPGWPCPCPPHLLALPSDFLSLIPIQT